MIICWDEEAWQDYISYQSNDKKTLTKINKLVKDIQRNGYDGLGKDEPLRYMDGDWHSKRINQKDRLVYRINGNRLEIIQCKEHYHD